MDEMVAEVSTGVALDAQTYLGAYRVVDSDVLVGLKRPMESYDSRSVRKDRSWVAPSRGRLRAKGNQLRSYPSSAALPSASARIRNLSHVASAEQVLIRIAVVMGRQSRSCWLRTRTAAVRIPFGSPGRHHHSEGGARSAEFRRPLIFG